ncbi:MAG: DNA repair protein RecN [Actinomycetota bacterium]|nr:DNA repair protein RecN [Actinomycetota bacterium]MDI7252119.1 DNA repair protein RecN [Actinomycetota bacterium]
MLRELQVRNLALIREARLEFGPGLNVLTGETGAGKTVLVEALGLLLGGRGDAGFVSPGSERMELEAAFDPPAGEGWRELLEAEGMEPEEEIILRRVISSDGRSRCYVNGRMCPVGTLARLGEYLVDIHGQHEHQRLLRPSTHLEYLDGYGPSEHDALLKEYHGLYRRWKEAQERYEAACLEEAERLREMDLLRYQVREIEAVNPEEGEMEELLRERRRMQNREELFIAAREAYGAVSGGEEGEGALDRLGEARRLLERAASLDDDLSGWAARLEEVEGILSELAREMHAYLEALDFQPGRLEEVEARLRDLAGLARKYGSDTGDILSYLERARRRLEDLEALDERREEFRAEAESLRGEVERAAEALRGSRARLAERLTREVNRELKELNMGGMRFRVRMEVLEEYGESGGDRVEFEVSPGKDLPYRPLARIASGGELSRIALALKLALARADAVPTLVFDEVDAGIGGATADVLARKLSGISRFHQVFSITHLPQVAAASDVHLAVEKRQTGKGIITEIRRLDGSGRVGELVRMLGGEERTAREHALAMLGGRASSVEGGKEG